MTAIQIAILVVLVLFVILPVLVFYTKWVASQLGFLFKAPVNGVKGTHKGINGLRARRLENKRVKLEKKLSFELLIEETMKRSTIQENIKVRSLKDKIRNLK